MKKIGIIGLGVISKYHILAINNTNKFKLVSACDINTDAKQKVENQNCSFWTDYKEMIKNENLDYVSITTPPDTHYEIIEYCLNHNINVLVEKPAVLDLYEFDKLVKLAKSKKLVFQVMYHWQNGNEVKKFIKLFNKNKIDKISVSANDPYVIDNAIKEDRIILKGAWIDSGVNILSFIKLLLPMNSFKIKKSSFKLCKKTNLPIYSNVDLEIDNVKVNIEIDWRNNLNQKITYIKLGENIVTLHHSNQCIIYNNKTINCFKNDRLTTHYYNYYKNFKEKSNYITSRKIHKNLLEVRKLYEKN